LLIRQTLLYSFTIAKTRSPVKISLVNI